MKKILVEICVGTSCYVMGASELMLIQEQFTPQEADLVEFKGATCLDTCMNPACGKAPFVRINGEVINDVTVSKLKELINQEIAKLGK